MIHLLVQKLIHKKWMMLSLLLGNILLISVAAAYPMFRDASLQRMYIDEYENYYSIESGEKPVVELIGKTRLRNDLSGYEWAAEKEGTILKELGLYGNKVLTHHFVQSSTLKIISNRDLAHDKETASIGMMEGLPENCEVVSGEMYSGVCPDGAIEAVVTVKCFVGLNLLVGDVVEFQYLKDLDNNPIRLKIVGVISEGANSKDYWVKAPDEYKMEMFIDENVYKEYFLGNLDKYEQNTVRSYIFDYNKLNYKNAGKLVEKTRKLSKEAPNTASLTEPGYMKFLEKYLDKQKKVEATLIILQVPVLVLMCAFIYMISGQIYSMEQNEIAMLRSRGASGKQILSLYLLQGGMMAGAGIVAGFPLGSFLCKVLGSSSAFLEFSQKRALGVRVSFSVVIYMLAAAVISVLMSVLPVVLTGNKSIVNTKVSKAVNKKPFWQKFFLDIVLILASLYGFYSFMQRKEALELQVLEGEPLDPLLYLSSSLFILGTALLMLRIIPFIAGRIYSAGKKKWSPAMFASFREISRSGSSRYFIMTFLIITVSLGIFNTTVARTIAMNNERNQKYLMGADVVIAEAWPNNKLSVQMNPDIPLVYQEPDFTKYATIDGVEETARVYVTKTAKVNSKAVTVMGINTKEFGEATSLPKGLLDKHYYTYLNEMSSNTALLLASSSFRDVLGYQIGDKVMYQIEGVYLTGIITDFVDYFPSFDNKSAVKMPDGSFKMEDRYLLVTHLQNIQSIVGMRPYSVWIKLKDGANADALYSYVKDNELKVAKFSDLSMEIDELKSDTLFQGTNGILTLSFLIILVICFVGYLIYWTLTISSRELLLGVLRAMGMSQKEVMIMLINEQIFSSVLPLLAGAVIGVVASFLYIPLIQIAYSASNQVLPLILSIKATDMVRLFAIIAAMIILCFVILGRQISRMKIAQALKLGED